jgi:hypothetical protein
VNATLSCPYIWIHSWGRKDFPLVRLIVHLTPCVYSSISPPKRSEPPQNRHQCSLNDVIDCGQSLGYFVARNLGRPAFFSDSFSVNFPIHTICEFDLWRMGRFFWFQSDMVVMTKRVGIIHPQQVTATGSLRGPPDMRLTRVLDLKALT